MNDNHWVLVHSNGADVIRVYDSLFQGFISKSLARQCAAIIRSMSDNLEFRIQHVQQQTNFNDCGPLAVTFLIDLLFGKDPTNHFI